MKTLDLDKIYKVIHQFVEERDWDQFHSIKNLSMALSVEASELAEIFQWMPEAASNQVKNNPEVMSKLEDEVADVFVYLLRLIAKTDIDLEKVVLQKMKKNEAKYPIELSKGLSKKYNEL
ncbi:MAG: nucleotide pyrophosphohydrolase [Bacteriovoracaceae bacterium]